MVPFLQINPNSIARPYLPITIINPENNISANTIALLDTGADECALPASYAGVLGHDLLKGQSKIISTGNGNTNVYSHTVCISFDTF